MKGIPFGDHVPRAGMGYAPRADVIAAPENLCVKLPPTADLACAAYSTLGAIALQGARQANLRLGEIRVVIGLGLLGQLPFLILKAGGIKVRGLDINDKAVAKAVCHSAVALKNTLGIAVCCN